jgi:hypothetical protein
VLDVRREALDRVDDGRERPAVERLAVERLAVERLAVERAVVERAAVVRRAGRRVVVLIRAPRPARALGRGA